MTDGRVADGHPTDAAGAPLPLRAVVADDEPLIREGLAEILSAEPGVTIVAACGDGERALAAVRAHAPDVLFLDGRMPGVDGLAVTRALGAADEGWPPAIVFATAHDRYALAAFEVSAADYPLKPFHAARVRAVAEVEWIEAADNYVAVHAADGSVVGQFEP